LGVWSSNDSFSNATLFSYLLLPCHWEHGPEGSLLVERTAGREEELQKSVLKSQG